MSEGRERFSPVKFIRTQFSNFQSRRAEAIATRKAHQDQLDQQEMKEREREIFERDCVVRSLESAFGLKATPHERLVRIDSLRGKDYGRSGKERVSSRTADYIQWISEQHTPLGHALQEYDMTTGRLGYEARQALEQGKIVLVSMHLIMPTHSGFHTAHVRLGEKGQLVLLSDNGAETFGFHDSGNFESFAFTKKPQVRHH